MYRVSFTGYRDHKLPFFGEDDPILEEFRKKLSDLILDLIGKGAREFYCGMALGVDTYAAEAVLKAKERFPEVKLIAVIPCSGQDKLWADDQQCQYRELLALCDRVISISDKYEGGCMLKRDRALVELCDILVAVYDGKPGGTRYTINYAKRSGRKVVELVPI